MHERFSDYYIGLILACSSYLLITPIFIGAVNLETIYQFTHIQIGWVFVLIGLATIAGSFLFGIVSVDLKQWMVSATALSLVASLWVFIRDTSFNYISSLLLISFSSGCIRPAITAWITNANHTPYQTSRALSYARVGSNLGFGIAVVLAAIVSSVNDKLCFIITILSSLLFITLLPRMNINNHAHSSALKSSTKTQLVLPTKETLFILGLTFYISIIIFSFSNYYQLYLRNNFHDYLYLLKIIGILHILFIALAEIKINKFLSQYTDKRRIVSLGTTFICAGFGLVVYAHTYLTVIGLFILYLIGESFFYTQIFVMLNQNKELSRESISSWFHVSIDGARVMSPLLLGAAYTRVGETTMWISIFYVGIALAFILRYSIVGYSNYNNPAVNE